MIDRTPTGDGDEEITPRVETVSEEDVRLVAAATGGVVATEVTVSLEDPEDRTPIGDLREHSTGLADSECGEHRTVGARAWCYRDGEWCYPDAPCRGCELPALRVRAEEAERQRDTAREALAGAGIVIASLRDQRDEALAAVQRVRDLHSPEDDPRRTRDCKGCRTVATFTHYEDCKTLAALDKPEGT